METGRFTAHTIIALDNPKLFAQNTVANFTYLYVNRRGESAQRVQDVIAQLSWTLQRARIQLCVRINYTPLHIAFAFGCLCNLNCIACIRPGFDEFLDIITNDPAMEMSLRSTAMVWTNGFKQ